MGKPITSPTLSPAAKAVSGEASDAAELFLPLWRELEASLLASQNALLSGDLAGLEQLTGEQELLQHKLSLVGRPQIAQRQIGTEGGVGSTAAKLAPPPISISLSSAVRGAWTRVLHLGRVQIALLARRQQGLRILRHRMAGLQSLYGPPARKPDLLMERGRKPAKEA
ncbi:MAG: hypothetical protein WCF26_06750 [Candidatus Sulfotelmatobacter sp.]